MLFHGFFGGWLRYSTRLVAAAWNMDCCHRRWALAGRMSLSHRGSIHVTVFLSRSEHWLLVKGSNPHPLFPIGLFLFAWSVMVISFVSSISRCFVWSLSTPTFDAVCLAVWCLAFSMVDQEARVIYEKVRVNYRIADGRLCREIVIVAHGRKRPFPCVVHAASFHRLEIQHPKPKHPSCTSSFSFFQSTL